MLGVTIHEWKPPFSAASGLCGALVTRNGGGDECGLPRDHPVHTTPEMPPLPTNLHNWHTTVRLYRLPSYLRARADDLERRMNGERPTPDPRSVADLFAHLNDPTPEQLRARIARLRAESARLAALATEIEGRVDV